MAARAHFDVSREMDSLSRFKECPTVCILLTLIRYSAEILSSLSETNVKKTFEQTNALLLENKYLGEEIERFEYDSSSISKQARSLQNMHEKLTKVS